MKRLESVMLICLTVAGTIAIGQTNAGQTDAGQTNGRQKQQKLANPSGSTSAGQDRGQQVFAQNCSRCHNAPEGFSPRISGTIARHMRVRASLSDADYQALLRFLNP